MTSARSEPSTRCSEAFSLMDLRVRARRGAEEEEGKKKRRRRRRQLDRLEEPADLVDVERAQRARALDAADGLEELDGHALLVDELLDVRDEVDALDVRRHAELALEVLLGLERHEHDAVDVEPLEVGDVLVEAELAPTARSMRRASRSTDAAGPQQVADLDVAQRAQLPPPHADAGALHVGQPSHRRGAQGLAGPPDRINTTERRPAPCTPITRRRSSGRRARRLRRRGWRVDTCPATSMRLGKSPSDFWAWQKNFSRAASRRCISSCTL